MAELWERDAWALADDVRAGHLRAREVLEEHLARIELLDPVLNAFAFLDEDGARRQADEIDRRIGAGGDPGPLAGVPIGVKDDVDFVEGMPSTHCSRLYAGRVAGTDSTHVARLRGAGAVVVGMTTAPEFGAGHWTASALYGVTRNPWDPSRTPGGSSGGSSAAVSAGMVPACTAADGGGSIRIPASYTGLFGLKPTFGRIPAGPDPIDVAITVCVGPLVRAVRDAARWLDVTAGPDVDDFTSLPAPTESYERAVVSGEAVERLRGTRAAWSSTFGYAVCEPEVERVTRHAAEVLCDAAGIELVDVAVELPHSFATWAVIAALDLGFHAREAWKRSDELTPVVGLAMELLRHLQPAQLFAAYAARHEVLRALASVFSQVDLVLSPTTATVAFGAEGPMSMEIAGQSVGPGDEIPYTMPFNLSGQPAVSIPAGAVPSDSAAGTSLPVGLQVAARRHREDLCLGAGALLEDVRPWTKLAPVPD